jgi:ankyrin repeat protein
MLECSKLRELKQKKAHFVKSYSIKHTLLVLLASLTMTGMLQAGKYDGILIQTAIHNSHIYATIILHYGANIDYKDENDLTPLMHATLHDSRDVVLLLLRKGASVDEISAYHTTALMLACTHDYREIASLLILYGANVNLTTEAGNNALTCAANSESMVLVALLLINGAQVTPETLKKIKWATNKSFSQEQRDIYDLLKLNLDKKPKLKSRL